VATDIDSFLSGEISFFMVLRSSGVAGGAFIASVRPEDVRRRLTLKPRSPSSKVTNFHE
jgi:hypothetical protein